MVLLEQWTWCCWNSGQGVVGTVNTMQRFKAQAAQEEQSLGQRHGVTSQEPRPLRNTALRI